MRRAEVYQRAALAGYLTETEAKEFRFEYVAGYKGRPVSLTMPVRTEPYEFDKFPPFFEGLLPEGRQLEALLRTNKLDRNDLMGQLLAVGELADFNCSKEQYIRLVEERAARLQLN